MYKIKQFQILKKRLQEDKNFIQVLWGPRQVGKTTLVEQVLQDFSYHHFASADAPVLKDSVWLAQQWEIVRHKCQQKKTPVILVIDEIQKVQNWSETIKYLWDEDKRKNLPIKVVLLGSSSLLIQKGLTESLAGRFELIPVMHWGFQEMQQAFGYDLDTYIYFGGYPGAASLVQDVARWRRYILDSIIETTLSRDILLLTRVDKPALIRQLFFLGCSYSAQILSYQKMLGQLQEKGNTVTLAHYLHLLEQACLLMGLQKFGTDIRKRSSSPKFQIFNSALLSAVHEQSFQEVRQNPDQWGRLVENAVGQHLVNSIQGTGMNLFYWRERDQEVDYVLTKQDRVIAIEVKSTWRKPSFNGMTSFKNKFKPKKTLLVGGGGMPIEEFLSTKIDDLFDN